MNHDTDPPRVPRRDGLGALATLGGAALLTLQQGDVAMADETAMPLLGMDLYDHSYHLDYGADATSYIDAFFQNPIWDEANRRLAGAPGK